MIICTLVSNESLSATVAEVVYLSADKTATGVTFHIEGIALAHRNKGQICVWPTLSDVKMSRSCVQCAFLLG